MVRAKGSANRGILQHGWNLGRHFVMRHRNKYEIEHDRCIPSVDLVAASS